MDFVCVTKLNGSVYFTADFLAATDRLELFHLCRQSDAIRMKSKGQFVMQSVCCSCSGYASMIFMSGMPLVFGSNLTLVTFFFFTFLKTFPLGVTFRVRLGLGLALY